MRKALIVPAVWFLACAGQQIRQGEPTPETVYGRDSGNAAIPKTGQSYVAGIEITDAKPTALIRSSEGLVATDGHYRIARPLEGDASQAVDGGEERFSGALIHARAPRFGEAEVGDPVFYLDGAGDSLQSARAANWQLGKVEGRDPILGKLVVSGHKVDPARGVLIPVDPIPAP
jgi:hypothetical protein